MNDRRKFMVGIKADIREEDELPFVGNTPTSIVIDVYATSVEEANQKVQRAFQDLVNEHLDHGSLELLVKNVAGRLDDKMADRIERTDYE